MFEAQRLEEIHVDDRGAGGHDHIGHRLVHQQAGAGAHDASAHPEASQPKEDVLDAEFEEVKDSDRKKA